LVSRFDVTSFDILVGPDAGFVRSVSAASYCGYDVTAESIVAGFGSMLAPSTQAATSIPLPTTLAGVSMKIKDSAGVERLAPLFFVSPGQINYQVPTGAALGPAIVNGMNGGSDFISAINIVKVAPALFTANADGRGVPAAFALRIKSDGSQTVEPV